MGDYGSYITGVGLVWFTQVLKRGDRLKMRKVASNIHILVLDWSVYMRQI